MHGENVVSICYQDLHRGLNLIYYILSNLMEKLMVGNGHYARKVDGQVGT